MKTMLEVREYKFEDGIELMVMLDRRQKKASFVGYNGHQYVDANFVFAGRGLKYMNGWKNILSDMQYVIDDIKKTMEEWEKEETETLIRMFDQLNDDKEDTSGGKVNIK